MAYAHAPDGERRKLDKKSKKIRFVGYSLTPKGYRLFDETNRKLYIRRDVEFNENDFGQKQALTTEPDQKGEDVKQNAGTTTKDEEEVPEMKKLEKEEDTKTTCQICLRRICRHRDPQRAPYCLSSM